MKTAQAVFVLHGDVNRKTNLLDLLNDKVYVVIWPGTNHEDAIKNMIGFNPERHELLEIGSREKLYMGRNNIINWCKEHDIRRFWMIDDDVHFRLGGPSQEFKDKVFTNDKYNILNVEFEDDVGLGGLTTAGVMFNNAKDAPMFSKRFVWGMIFIDLDYNNIMYSVEGYDDIDMQLECVKNNIKVQTINWLGQSKPSWLTKKSLNSQISKINFNNFLIYQKWGDTVKIDVYYDKKGNKYFRVHLKWPYKIKNELISMYPKDSLENFVAALEEDLKEHPEHFKICGLPWLKKENSQK